MTTVFLSRDRLRRGLPPAALPTSASIARLVAAGCTAVGIMSASAAHASLPEIRSSQHNHVPSCATPDRLMAFTRQRNTRLDGRFRDIAHHYKMHGEKWRVRWDYAFFQMLVETNYLTFRRPDGTSADVHPRQNNFAGLGATGGIPGDSFPNVSTGVLAQIQHLVVYSGERIAEPTAPRTRLKMNDIVEQSRSLTRRVTFRDLAGRWAADRAYGRTIEFTAQAFTSSYCHGQPVASDGGSMPRYQRVSAAWPRPPRGEAPVREQARSDDGERRVRHARRPLRRPLMTASVSKNEPNETPSTPSRPTTERASTQRAMAAAPPPAITMKPAAQTPPTATARPAEPAAPDKMASVTTPPPSATTTATTSSVSKTTPATPPATAPSASPATTTLPASEPPSATTTATTASVGSAQAAGPPASSGGAPGTAQIAAVPKTAPSRPVAPCKIFRASYGGPKTVLIQSQKEQTTNYTVLEVTAGREQDQAKAFMDAHARGGKIIGEFPVEADALKKSFELCPGG